MNFLYIENDFQKHGFTEIYYLYRQFLSFSFDFNGICHEGWEWDITETCKLYKNYLYIIKLSIYKIWLKFG